MNKKNLKIPENVHVHENFRTWKSGKQWLYASSVLALIVAVGAIAAPSVKADQVLPGQQTGADNTIIRLVRRFGWILMVNQY